MTTHNGQPVFRGASGAGAGRGDDAHGVTGHADLDSRVDKILEKNGRSIDPSSPGWNSVWNHIEQGNKRDSAK